MVAQDRAHLRSVICAAGHELRITHRCVREDLGESPDAPFEELQGRYGIVRAFRRERRAATSGADSLGAAGGPRPLTVLRHTHHLRGVTWFDEREEVVWLCACGRHRSGDADDAFPFFERLRAGGHIWPNARDYEALAYDRSEQFAALVLDEAPRLLTLAQSHPGTEHVMVIGREPVAIVVRVVETLRETFVAVSGLHLGPNQFQILLVALYPDRGYREWRFEQRLPTRELDRTRAEICLSIVHG